VPVALVIVHWNQPERCATTIERFQHQGVPVETIVVDNGSEPTKLARLRQIVDASPSPVELIELGRNTGFGPGANAGLRRWLDHASGEWAVVAPHDALPDDRAVQQLVEAAEARPRAGLACADVGDGHLPVVDPYFGGMTVEAPRSTPTSGWVEVDYPHGTLLLARRACLDEIGLFDERYFAYCEEADLGLRARNAGWEVGLVRGVRVTNPTMRSGSPAVDYLMHRNTLLLVREHSSLYHAAIRFGIAGVQLARGVAQPSSRTFIFSAKGRALGMVDFVRGRYGPPPAAMFAEAGEPPTPADPAQPGSGKRPSSAAAI
jgi:N-acetylglucosaminyl-diphospho-decaprenol L-rhamnosyltransferase